MSFGGFLGDEYQDFDLVVALPNGRPCEDRIILKEFEKLREKAGLPRVVFHSLRHSSTTYKLKLNHGDLKATQGDTGHAEIDMITSVYAHILDEDRKINAQKFESAFYAKPRSSGGPSRRRSRRNRHRRRSTWRPWWNSSGSRRNWQIPWLRCSRRHRAAGKSENSN